jgi:tetratricopeptide (TPR) repeat protein
MLNQNLTYETSSSTTQSMLSKKETTQAGSYFFKDFHTKFRSLSRFYALFHIIFLSVGFLQILGLLLFFSFFMKSSWSAIALASVFLTAFSYLVLHFYFQAKKPQQFLELRQDFIDTCSSLIEHAKGSSLYHESLCGMFQSLSESLHHHEATYYPLSTSFKTLSPLMQKFSIWVHWKDVHKMKELLLLSSVNETICQVKLSPLNLEAHAHLASAYLKLSDIYIDPKKAQPDLPHLWVSEEYQSAAMIRKFHSACDRAIEELNILNEYAPDDLWVHTQLAKIYNRKDLPDLEIKEYETLQNIKPNDPSILFRLGVLYFKQGMNSHGMRMYEQIKNSQEELAEELISHYDSFQFHDMTIESL